MKRLFMAVTCAAFLCTPALAQSGANATPPSIEKAIADEATGLITNIDSGSITLSDGKVYLLSREVAAVATFKVGDNVKVSFTADPSGKLNAIDVKPAGN